MDNIILRDQLDDLLEMMGCSENQSFQMVSKQVINPLERLLKTKPIWCLLDVSRQESIKLLHNKKPGNFLIRGSRQPNTMAISVKLGSNHGSQVNHFVILQKERKVCLEDSDLQFDNIVSLAFHYSHVCDELPEKLSLPEVLTLSSSVQNLVSLSLLGKSFWSYPMARSERESLLGINNACSTQDSIITPAIHPCESNNDLYKNSTHFSESGPIYVQSSNLAMFENSNTKVTKTPPTAPRKSSLQTNSPPSRNKVRRNSDSVPFITSPARAPQLVRNSLSSLHSVSPPVTCTQDTEECQEFQENKCHDNEDCQEWVTSPVFSPDNLAHSRLRKLSVFDSSLGCVPEIHEHEDGDKEAVYEDISEQVLGTRKNELPNKDEDYAYPVDAVNEDMEHNIYEDPIYHIARLHDDHQKEAPSPVISNSTDTVSDQNMRYGKNVTNISDSQDDDLIKESEREERNIGKRKLSLGVILRKISSGSLQGRDRKTSLQERRLSSALSKLITLPTFVRKTLSENNQIDCSSWEFLNRDVDDDCWNKKVDEKSSGRDLTKHKRQSKDSLYDSEYDSSSTLESSSCRTSPSSLLSSETVTLSVSRTS